MGREIKNEAVCGLVIRWSCTRLPPHRYRHTKIRSMRRTLALAAQKTMGFTKTLIREGVSVA